MDGEERGARSRVGVMESSRCRGPRSSVLGGEVTVTPSLAGRLSQAGVHRDPAPPPSRRAGPRGVRPSRRARAGRVRPRAGAHAARRRRSMPNALALSWVSAGASGRQRRRARGNPLRVEGCRARLFWSAESWGRKGTVSQRQHQASEQMWIAFGVLMEYIRRHIQSQEGHHG